MSKQEKLNEVEKRKLESEYRELCRDWWERDKNVLARLPAAGILFTLLGVAVYYIPSTLWWLKLCPLSIGSLYSLVLNISVAKDIYYRDGTEKLLRRLSARLGIDSSLQSLKSLKGFDDGLDLHELQFPRKIRIQPDKFSLSPLPQWLTKRLVARRTFRWILAFYLVSFSIFLTLIILILVNHRWGINLPI